MLVGALRRSVPRAAAQHVDWNQIVSKCVDDEHKAEVMRFKAEVAEIEGLHQKFSVTPEPIDWTQYKEFFGNHPEIAKLESDYTSASLPQYVPEDESEIRARFEPSVSEVKAIRLRLSHAVNTTIIQSSALQLARDLVAESKAKVEELTARVAFLEENKTTAETTVADVWEKYPEIEKEVDQEIANHEWCTNIK
ncbi:unnamed protein product [Choristocarpus tenellus]